MEWTPEKVEELRELCFADVENAEIAKKLGCGIRNIWAKRSQLGITRDKVKAAKQQPETHQKEDKPGPGCLASPVNPVRDAFSALHSALLVAAANDHISEEKTKAYMSVAASVTELEYLLTVSVASR